MTATLKNDLNHPSYKLLQKFIQISKNLVYLFYFREIEKKSYLFQYFGLFFLSVLSPLSSASALEEVTFQLDWLPGGDKAPIYVGIEKGYFKDVGIDVKIASGRGSTDAITKLSVGKSDIGSVGLGAVLLAKAQHNVPVTAIYSMFTKPPHAFLTTKDKGIATVSDLKRKKVATSPFTSSNVFLPLILERNGLTIDDIVLIKADPGALGPMLAMGRVDAIIEWVTNSPRHRPHLAKMKKEMVTIPWAEAGMEIYATSLVASDRFIQEKPELAKRFLAAFVKSMTYTREHHREAAEIVNRFVAEVPVDVAELSIGHFTRLSKNAITEAEGEGVFNSERLIETWRWVSRAQDVPFESFDPEKAVNRDFVQ